MPENEAPLDLLSTSQTNRCIFGAPLVAILKDGYASIQQACCNHWECPRCGQTRAREEYRRIVHGCEVLAASHPLYFWTITCRGKECSLEEAEENYYAWTNVLLTNARTVARRKGLYWAYTQVTERQKKNRRHPHSHIVTTFLPPDSEVTGGKGDRQSIVSRWFSVANESAGLGVQHRISVVANAEAASRYIAKYLFKESMTERWPAKWKRVRYSQNWPDLPHWTPDWAITLFTPSDWRSADRQEVTWFAEDVYVFEKARRRLENVHRADIPLTQSVGMDERILVTPMQGTYA